MTAKVSKIRKGHYGTGVAISIPPIAKGYGSVQSFQLEFSRTFTYRHKKQSFAKARCLDGKLQGGWIATLADGNAFDGIFKRACTPAG